MTWRWIAYGPADGATQMATDRAVLESAGDLGTPTMRVYGWRPFCISLGYHQDAETLDLERCAEDGVDVVRRPTGGRAVLHAEELTYSLVFPKDHAAVRGSIGEVYRRVSEGLAAGLRRQGIPAVLEKRALDLQSHYRTTESVSCFSAAARHEILVEGKKLVGSAQRRTEWGVLQHGSILLGDAHLRLPYYLKAYGTEDKERLRRIMAEKTTHAGDHLSTETHSPALADSIRGAMEEAFSMTFEAAGLTADEEKKVEILRERFSIFDSKRGDAGDAS